MEMSDGAEVALERDRHARGGDRLLCFAFSSQLLGHFPSERYRVTHIGDRATKISPPIVGVPNLVQNRGREGWAGSTTTTTTKKVLNVCISFFSFFDSINGQIWQRSRGSGGVGFRTNTM